MTTFAITNRPAGSEDRSIDDILDNFDDILTPLNNEGIDTGNIADYAISPIKMGTMPHWKVSRTVVQDIPRLTPTAVIFDAANSTEVFDSATIHDPTTNPTRFTLATPGLYYFDTVLRWDEEVQRSQALIYKNGVVTTDILSSGGGGGFNPGTFDYHYSGLVRIAANDYLELYVQYESGANPEQLLATFSGTFLSR